MEFLEPKPNSYPTYFYKHIRFTKQGFIEDILVKNRLYFSFANEFKGDDEYDCRAFNFVIKNKEDRKAIILDEIDTK